MRFKYKIPPFVFGVSIGLLVGVAFFIFKIDGYLKKYGIPYKGQYDIKNAGPRKSKRKYGRKDTKNKTRYNHKNKK